MEEIRGGEFRHGFYAGFAGSVAGSLTGSGPLSGDGLDRIAERTAIAAVVGGTASALGGGKFANGATTAAFQHLFNAEGGGTNLVEKIMSLWKEIMGPQIVHPQNPDAPVPLAEDDDQGRVANRQLAVQKAQLVQAATGVYRQGLSIRFRPEIWRWRASDTRFDFRVGVDTYDGVFYSGGADARVSFGPSRFSFGGAAGNNGLNFRAQLGIETLAGAYSLNPANLNQSLTITILGPFQISWHSQPLVSANATSYQFIR